MILLSRSKIVEVHEIRHIDAKRILFFDTNDKVVYDIGFNTQDRAMYFMIKLKENIKLQAKSGEVVFDSYELEELAKSIPKEEVRTTHILQGEK